MFKYCFLLIMRHIRIPKAFLTSPTMWMLLISLHRWKWRYMFTCYAVCENAGADQTHDKTCFHWLDVKWRFPEQTFYKFRIIRYWVLKFIVSLNLKGINVYMSVNLFKRGQNWQIIHSKYQMCNHIHSLNDLGVFIYQQFVYLIFWKVLEAS